MSYLLDALKKTDPKSQVEQPMQPYQQAPSSNNDSALRFYRGLAIVLGLILAMIVGYGLGNVYGNYQRTQAEHKVPTITEVSETGYVIDNLEPVQSANVDLLTTDSTKNEAELNESDTRKSGQENNTEKQEANELATEKTAEEEYVYTDNKLSKESEVKNVASESALSSDSAEQPKVEAGYVSTEEPAFDASNIDPQLLKEFNQAVRETEQHSQDGAGGAIDANFSSSTVSSAPMLGELPASVQDSIPALSFDAHIYSTDAQQSWVKVNGKVLQERQWVTSDIQLLKILPQQVILEKGNNRFSLPALENWSGSY
ncbi:general secretion pathway protein GspB [Flocculibacter collagenilyticus]|uniref:general secretion pathway protein GspB n=1 Tax=Flocculibacter collagenilyticus TaxID=2744479 RepID=UPI0018F41D41|nr:general secretion pathway protein GspB [Flocculibacter collagenilyticus]